jgi:uncharacterized protein
LDLFKRIQDTLLEGDVEEVRIGLHWTAVVVRIHGKRHCGLAATLYAPDEQHGDQTFPYAGQLTQLSGKELAKLAEEGSSLETSIGLAAINALLPRYPNKWTEENAEEVIARYGEGKSVALIGHFPFVPSLEQRVGKLIVLELKPKPGDLPASEAPRILPDAEVVAMTGMTISNHTFDELIGMCNPYAKVIILGPSTPLSPLLFDLGVDAISGAVVTEIDPVLRIISEGGNFRQVHRGGVRLVNLIRGRDE